MAWDFSNILHKSLAERRKEDVFVNSIANDNTFSTPELSSATDDSPVFIYLSHVSLQGIPLQTEIPTIWLDKRIEDTSKLILRTFNETYEQLFVPVMQSAPLPNLQYKSTLPERDFSLLISSLARILEIELNLSLIQWFRCQHGISMPKYFDRLAPEIPAFVSVNGNEYHINKPNPMHQKELCKHTLGSIRHIIKDMDKLLPHEIRCMQPSFCHTITKICELRNDASHTRICDEQTFCYFHSLFCKIIEEGWLSNLMDLKSRLRGF